MASSWSCSWHSPTPVIIGDPSPAVRLAHSRYPATQRVGKCPCQRTAERNKRLSLIQSTPSFSCVPHAVPSPRRRSRGFQVSAGIPGLKRSPLFRPGDYGWLAFEWCSVTKSFFHRTVAEWMRRMPLQMCETSLLAFDWREAARSARLIQTRGTWPEDGVDATFPIMLCETALHRHPFEGISLGIASVIYVGSLLPPSPAEPRLFWNQIKVLMV